VLTASSAANQNHSSCLVVSTIFSLLNGVLDANSSISCSNSLALSALHVRDVNAASADCNCDVRLNTHETKPLSLSIAKNQAAATPKLLNHVFSLPITVFPLDISAFVALNLDCSLESEASHVLDRLFNCLLDSVNCLFVSARSTLNAILLSAGRSVFNCLLISFILSSAFMVSIVSSDFRF
jgi:hypothetical protein